MKTYFNYISETIEFSEDNNIKIIKFKDIFSYEKCVFENVKFLYISTSDNEYFLCESQKKYIDLLYFYANHKNEFDNLLTKYQNSYSIYRNFVGYIMTNLIQRFNIAFPQQFAFAPTLSVLKQKYSSLFFIETDFDMVETGLKKITSQNYAIDKIEYLKVELDRVMQKYKINGNDLFQHLLKEGKNDYRKLYLDLQYEKQLFEKGKENKFYNNNTEIEKCLQINKALMDNTLTYIAEQDLNYIQNKYGKFLSEKNDFIRRIEKKSFLDLQNKYQIYHTASKTIKQEIVQRQISIYYDETNYNPWNDVDLYFEHACILIKDKMNHLNRNKDNIHGIPTDKINNAMIYFYNTDSVEEAYEQKSIDQYKDNKVPGKKGEDSVNFALKWLDKKYIQIEPRSLDKAGDKCILLKNENFIDVSQEYDHIIVSPKGIFVIETKNYKGQINIDKYHNWSRTVNGVVEGLTNPLQQIRQHEKLLKSFLAKNIPIISIICLANNHSTISGIENSDIELVKSDRISEYIEKYDLENILSLEEVKECVDLIYKYMVIE